MLLFMPVSDDGISKRTGTCVPLWAIEVLSQNTVVIAGPFLYFSVHASQRDL